MACRTIELAEATTEAAERRRDQNPGAAAIAASAAHARGLLTGDRERLVEAVSVLQSAECASLRKLALASAVEDLAVANARAGAADEAVSCLERALALYAACDARWDEARVRRRLRNLGVRRRLVTPRRPSSGWPALTDSEVAVVRLVADGLTNRAVAERLYLSPHTVSAHLRHAFDKLGVNSRVVLTRMAAAENRQSSADKSGSPQMAVGTGTP